MKNQKEMENIGSGEAKLTTLMHSVVETRSQLAKTRMKLQKIEQKISGQNQTEMETRRAKALSEYIEAMGRARVARTRLLNRLREHRV